MSVLESHGSLNPNTIDTGAIETEIPDQPLVVLEIYLGVQAGSQLVPDDNGIIPASSDGDRLIYRTFQDRRLTLTRFDHNTYTHDS
jgi:hypothetical protein